MNQNNKFAIFRYAPFDELRGYLIEKDQGNYRLYFQDNGTDFEWTCAKSHARVFESESEALGYMDNNKYKFKG